MKRSKNFSPIIEYAPEIADLVMSGIQWLTYLDGNERDIHFVEWSKLIWAARGEHSDLSADQLIWVWDTLTAEPRIQKALGEKLVPLDEDWRKVEETKEDLKYILLAMLAAPFWFILFPLLMLFFVIAFGFMILNDFRLGLLKLWNNC